MSSANTARVLLSALCALGVVAVSVMVWLVFRGRPQDAERGPDTAPAASGLFRECATDVGITWQMHFLPNEQGETFKINLYDHGCGLAVGDFDGDGHEDIYFCNELGPNVLYRNRGDGTFEDVTEKAGVALGDRVCVAATFVDYDNDGRQDLFVTSTRGGNVLFRNLGNGKFQDVTKQAGLAHVGHSQTALFFDFDNDGYLDLFLTNTAEWTSATFDKSTRYYVGKGDLGGVMLSRKEHNILYRNNGDGTFSDVTEKAGLKGLGWAGDAVAFDYDGDGYTDLFVTNMFGRCQLYRNNGNGTFTDVTLKVLGRTSWGGIGTKVFDYNNDGLLDLLVVDMHSDMWMGADFNHESEETARASEKKKFSYFHGPRVLWDAGLIQQEKELAEQVGWKPDDVLFGNVFFRNEGNGKFTEISDQAGLETFWPWGIATGDFDNDGLEDVFLPSGMGYPFYYWPNQLLMNQGDGTFRNRATDFGIEPPRRGINLPNTINGKPAVRSSRCAVTADFDGDGRLEIVTNNFNDQPYFFKNQCRAKNYVAFRLRGTRSNRDAIGAVVHLHQGKKTLTRQVDGACGYLSQSSRTLHFGLGDQPQIDWVEITWPSGMRQRLDAVAANKLHEIVEPAAGNSGKRAAPRP
jgi:enediyne biosynthesis protein E4